jgi:hypothetical protein
MSGPDIFSERGIRPEIAEARPYLRWTRENTQPLKDAWYPFVSKGQRSFVGKVANQSDGYVITRHPPPGLGLELVPAEIRPDNEVDTRPAYYQRQREADGREPKLAKYIFPPSSLLERERWHDHAEMKPEHRARHIERAHGGEDIRGSHPHTRKVKDKSSGLAKRLDMHPAAMPLFEDADRVFFGIEG